MELEVVAAQPSWGEVTETRRSGRAPVDGCSEGMVAEAWTVRFASTYGGGSAVLAVLEIGSRADVDTVEVGDEADAAVVDRIVAFVHGTRTFFFFFFFFFLFLFVHAWSWGLVVGDGLIGVWATQ